MRAPASAIIERAPDDAFARLRDGSVRSVAEFCGDVRACAERLPARHHLINACDDRYRFVVVFFAALTRGHTNLLPAFRTPEAIEQLRRAYPDSGVVTDECVAADPAGRAPVPSVPGDHLAAIAFTSGSTGEPQAQPKTWRALREASRVHARCLPAATVRGAALIATVPPWHMYGLEWSMLLPTVAPLTLECATPLYPEDIRRVLARSDAPRLLVSTPVHLRAMVRALPDCPAVANSVCATAPLDVALARQVEALLGGRLLEIYGCSEAGSLAWRRPIEDPLWELLEPFEARIDGTGQVEVRAPFLPAPVRLADRLAFDSPRRFSLLGRDSDLVKVAGKRASLASLTRALLAIDGVEDGLFFDPAALGLPGSDRVGALVVAPGLGADVLRDRLAAVLDPAFLPRPLRLVRALPRTATGKLTHAMLRALLEPGSGA